MKELIQVGRIAAVKVPEDAKDIEIYIGKLYWYIPFESGSKYQELPQGNWTILGRALELTEQQKEMCVEKKKHIVFSYHVYKDYSQNYVYTCWVNDLIKSYTSLLEAHQIDNNYIIILNKEG